MTLKRKFKFIRIVAVMCLAIVFMSFCACTNEPTEETHPADTTAQTTAEEIDTTAETTAESSLKLLSDYKPSVAYGENGEEVSADTVYGSAYHDYGGTLSFADDGTFTTYIGAFKNDGGESGTYKILSDTEIEMTLDNSEVRIATILSVDNGTVTELEYFHRGFDVVFIAE